MLQNIDVVQTISAMFTVPMEATSNVDLTLTCNIGDLTKAVDVTWKDPFGSDIIHSQEGYTITKGTVGEGNVQESTLTIAAATLKRLDTDYPLTWKCAAKSTLYAESEMSTFSDVVVTFLTFGKFRKSVR